MMAATLTESLAVRDAHRGKSELRFQIKEMRLVVPFDREGPDKYE
jgi:hypothetical protein